MKFPKTLRLDSSDAQAFHRAAQPGEWAVPGAFAFYGRDPDRFDGKDKLAFRSGWLGLDSLGHASLVQVADIEADLFDGLVERLADRLVADLGAPDLATARTAARQETEYAAALCDHPVNTLLALERDLGEDGIRESFRVIMPSRSGEHAKIWEIVPDETEPAEAAPKSEDEAG